MKSFSWKLNPKSSGFVSNFHAFPGAYSEFSKLSTARLVCTSHEDQLFLLGSLLLGERHEGNFYAHRDSPPQTPACQILKGRLAKVCASETQSSC